MAGGPGFEPRLTGPEPVVLPLHHPPSSVSILQGVLPQIFFDPLIYILNAFNRVGGAAFRGSASGNEDAKSEKKNDAEKFFHSSLT